MTQEHTEPHYKDHTTRGGLKLRPMFSIDPFGRNTLELVCPDLRAMDADMVEGFLEIAKDRIKETLRDMRNASPDGKIDCHLIGPKPGYKHDRITLKGDTTLLMEIAQHYGAQHTMTTDLTPTAARHKIKQRAYGCNALDSTEYMTVSLKRAIQGKGADTKVEFYMQVKNTLSAMDSAHNPGSYVTNARQRISADGFGEGRDGIVTDTTDELKAKGIMKVTCALKDAVWVARRFSDACGTDVRDLEHYARSICKEREGNTHGR